MSAGAVTSIDNNMSFGLLLHGYENVSKRNLGNKNDPWFLGAAATVDILSLGIGMEETYRGAGMLFLILEKTPCNLSNPWVIVQQQL